jgi:hypothetical protein
VQHTFTIENRGNADLVLDGSPLVELSGPGAAFYSVGQPALSTIPAGGSTTFSLTFAPTNHGEQQATVTISNNDGNTDPYTFAVNGLGLAPDIFVTGNGLTISHNDLLPSPADGTDFGSVDISTGSATQNFVIQNNGNVTLYLSPVLPVSLDSTAAFSLTGCAGAYRAGGGHRALCHHL